MLVDIYESADVLPIFNYYMLFKSNDLRYLFRDTTKYNKEISINETEFLQKKFDELLFTQTEFVLNETQKFKILILIKELLNELEFKPILKNEIEYLRKKVELSESKNEKKEWNLNEEIIILSKWLGFHIDKFKMCANEYFSCRKNYLHYIEMQKVK